MVGVICCYQEALMIDRLFSFTLPVENKDRLNEPCIEERKSITFILGDDKEEDNRYYKEATAYYTNNAEGKTNYLITTFRSLTEVRDYLEVNAPTNGLPWGRINLVSHGNQWTGLSVKVAPGAKRSTPKRIEEYINSNDFCPMSKNTIDEKTEIFLHGCGVGNNEALVNILAKAFRSEEHQPLVRASKLFEYYASAQTNNVVQTEHYLANSWFTCYAMGERPSENVISNEFHDKYPTASVDWHHALQTTTPRWIGDTYHYTFEVPVKWVIPVTSDSIPSLTSVEAQLQWLKQQSQIIEELTNIDIPMEKFTWSFTTVYINNDDGTKSPAVWVKGYCTILCVLQALTNGHDYTLALQKPFTPDPDNGSYYYSTRTSELISYNKLK